MAPLPQGVRCFAATSLSLGIGQGTYGVRAQEFGREVALFLLSFCPNVMDVSGCPSCLDGRWWTPAPTSPGRASRGWATPGEEVSRLPASHDFTVEINRRVFSGQQMHRAGVRVIGENKRRTGAGCDRGGAGGAGPQRKRGGVCAAPGGQGGEHQCRQVRPVCS